MYRSEEEQGSYLEVGDVDTTAFEDGGLESKELYYYKVSAYDGKGNESVGSGVVSVETRGVSRPEGLEALGGVGRIELVWRGNAEEDLIGYGVYRSESYSGTYVRLSTDGVTVGTTSYTDSSVVV